MVPLRNPFRTPNTWLHPQPPTSKAAVFGGANGGGVKKQKVPSLATSKDGIINDIICNVNPGLINHGLLIRGVLLQ